MPTHDDEGRVQPRDATRLIGEIAFAPAGLDDHRGVGLEVEVFPLSQTDDGWQRLPRAVSVSRLEELGGDASSLVAPRLSDDPLAAWPAASGRLTFEPGGQIEYSGGPRPTAADALRDSELVLGELARSWAGHGDRLVAVGFDAWSDLDEVPQQLRSGRYEAMDAYFAARGGSGHRMMRHTCALQVNLDPGVGQVGRERWQVANLVSPLLAATFATSPAPTPDPGVSVRARSWRRLDPTRTGVPAPWSLVNTPDHVEAYAQWALDADVLLFRRPDGGADPGRPGFRFRDWLEQGDPERGWPTGDDLVQHVSTLFPEVRPRGPVELRSIDALPARWRAVPVVLVTGLLYDDEARRRALTLLAPRADQVRDDLVRAGESGLKDPELCAPAVEVWSFAREGAERLGLPYNRPEDLRQTDEFIDEFVLRGRCPADDLRERLAADPVAALHWMAEPFAARSLDLR